jgi:hypothetical protein
VTGRWPSRDPIQELGGANLYSFVFNSSINWHEFAIEKSVEALTKDKEKCPKSGSCGM